MGSPRRWLLPVAKVPGRAGRPATYAALVLLGGVHDLLYFLRAEAYLIDPSVAALTKPAAIAIALAVLVASWLVYDGLCRSPLGRNARALAIAVAVVTAIEAWGVCQLFGGRGAFMVFGAALGTIMVANVLFVIIPGQRELVRAKKEGRDPDPAPGLRGKQRSVHNTYFTLPVLFVMISNHYAMTYGARNNWLVLIAMSFAGACIRGWFVARHKPAGRRGAMAAMPAVLGVLTLAGVVVALAPQAGPSPLGAGAGVGPSGVGPGRGFGPGDGPSPLGTGAGVYPGAESNPVVSSEPNPGKGLVAGSSAVAPPGDLAQVQSIVEQRCVPCHSTHPSSKFGFAAPPNGIVLETLDQLRAHLPEVQKQVSLRTMPLGNLTGMTEGERATVLMWIGHGAAGHVP
jgi:uncharacterized membrane protein